MVAWPPITTTVPKLPLKARVGRGGSPGRASSSMGMADRLLRRRHAHPFRHQAHASLRRTEGAIDSLHAQRNVIIRDGHLR
jgi:hypothetical protein